MLFELTDTLILGILILVYPLSLEKRFLVTT